MRRLILPVLAVSAAWIAGTAPGGPNHRGQGQGTPCAGKPSADTLIYAMEALDNLPRQRTHVAPHFSVVPKLGTELRVRLSFVINQSGSVDTASIRLLDSTRTAFDQDARRHAATLVFWPGCREEKAVRVRAVMPLNYAQPGSGRGPIR